MNRCLTVADGGVWQFGSLWSSKVNCSRCCSTAPTLGGVERVGGRRWPCTLVAIVETELTFGSMPRRYEDPDGDSMDERSPSPSAPAWEVSFGDDPAIRRETAHKQGIASALERLRKKTAARAATASTAASTTASVHAPAPPTIANKDQQSENDDDDDDMFYDSSENSAIAARPRPKFVRRKQRPSEKRRFVHSSSESDSEQPEAVKQNAVRALAKSAARSAKSSRPAAKRSRLSSVPGTQGATASSAIAVDDDDEEFHDSVEELAQETDTDEHVADASSIPSLSSQRRAARNRQSRAVIESLPQRAREQAARTADVADADLPPISDGDRDNSVKDFVSAALENGGVVDDHAKTDIAAWAGATVTPSPKTFIPWTSTASPPSPARSNAPRSALGPSPDSATSGSTSHSSQPLNPRPVSTASSPGSAAHSPAPPQPRLVSPARPPNNDQSSRTFASGSVRVETPSGGEMHHKLVWTNGRQTLCQKFLTAEVAVEWAETLEDSIQSLGASDVSDVWNTFRACVEHDLLESAKKEFAKEKEERAFWLFLEESALAAAKCNGTCAAHYCVGEKHALYSATKATNEDPFGDRAVKCTDMTSRLLCVTCDVSRWIALEVQNDRWEESMKGIMKRDEARRLAFGSKTPTLTESQAGRLSPTSGMNVLPKQSPLAEDDLFSRISNFLDGDAPPLAPTDSWGGLKTSMAERVGQMAEYSGSGYRDPRE